MIISSTLYPTQSWLSKNTQPHFNVWESEEIHDHCVPLEWILAILVVVHHPVDNVDICITGHFESLVGFGFQINQNSILNTSWFNYGGVDIKFQNLVKSEYAFAQQNNISMTWMTDSKNIAQHDITWMRWNRKKQWFLTNTWNFDKVWIMKMRKKVVFKLVLVMLHKGYNFLELFL